MQMPCSLRYPMMILVSKDVKCQKIERGWQVAIGNLPKGPRKSLKVDLRNLVPRKLVRVWYH